MKFVTVEYRTKNREFSSYAVIPYIWLSDFTHWIRSCGGKIIGTTDNANHPYHGLSVLDAPIDWPSYRSCSSAILLSEHVGTMRQNCFIGR